MAWGPEAQTETIGLYESGSSEQMIVAQVVRRHRCNDKTVRRCIAGLDLITDRRGRADGEVDDKGLRSRFDNLQGTDRYLIELERAYRAKAQLGPTSALLVSTTVDMDGHNIKPHVSASLTLPFELQVSLTNTGTRAVDEAVVRLWLPRPLSRYPEGDLDVGWHDEAYGQTGPEEFGQWEEVLAGRFGTPREALSYTRWRYVALREHGYSIIPSPVGYALPPLVVHTRPFNWVVPVPIMVNGVGTLAFNRLLLLSITEAGWLNSYLAETHVDEALAGKIDSDRRSNDRRPGWSA